MQANTSMKVWREFTGYHIRSFLTLLASYPEVEKIHLIAQSRGTDVALNGVREITIAARGAAWERSATLRSLVPSRRRWR